ncbi:hypothetical protein E3J95_00740 [Candidatus Aerophobetes bacterium]|uniref:Uncharacterized protein n=1 Tax=Aerophobetes bacterium TaxID=2030807 RepID=A0A523QMB8_UNCAE|nr:MAG: hypothetical protein E3J95_00740 [Candidatus Aerophobetes bacterium]
MNTQIVAILIAEGGKLLGQVIRNRPIRIKIPPPEATEGIPEATPEAKEIPEPEEARILEAKPLLIPVEDKGNGEQATKVATGCVPCAIGHFGTCSGLLNESMRFAHKDGLGSDEVIDRVNMCLDELNTMERVDLRPELIADLPEWEKKLAERSLLASRETRHGLEELKSVKELEHIAADTQTARTTIGRLWFREKLRHMKPEEKEELHNKVMRKLETLVEAKESEDTEDEEVTEEALNE